MSPQLKHHILGFRYYWMHLLRTYPKLKWEKWKEVINDASISQECKNALFVFRAQLAKFIQIGICEHVKCKTYGSTKLSSDIDMTIGNGSDIRLNADTLIHVHNFLSDVFHSKEEDLQIFSLGFKKTMNVQQYVNFFKHNNSFELKKVFEFFDLNFYLSNFALKNNIERYILSDAYGKDNPLNQFKYAFMEPRYNIHEYKKKIAELEFLLLLSSKINNEDVIDNHSTIINGKIDQIHITQKRHRHNPDNVQQPTTKINVFDGIRVETPQLLINKIIDLISQISLYEDECYHTQGAFFHIVMMMQRNIKFDITNPTIKSKEVYSNLIKASCMENMFFASTHPHNVDKYLTRVADGLTRLSIIGSNNNNFVLHFLDKVPETGILNSSDVDYPSYYNNLFKNILTLINNKYKHRSTIATVIKNLKIQYTDLLQSNGGGSRKTYQIKSKKLKSATPKKPTKKPKTK